MGQQGTHVVRLSVVTMVVGVKKGWVDNQLLRQPCLQRHRVMQSAVTDAHSPQQRIIWCCWRRGGQ